MNYEKELYHDIFGLLNKYGDLGLHPEKQLHVISDAKDMMSQSIEILKDVVSLNLGGETEKSLSRMLCLQNLNESEQFKKYR